MMLDKQGQRRQWLFKVRGQIVIQVEMQGGAFYSAKKWGGNCPPLPPPPLLTPLKVFSEILIKYSINPSDYLHGIKSALHH